MCECSGLLLVSEERDCAFVKRYLLVEDTHNKIYHGSHVSVQFSGAEYIIVARPSPPPTPELCVSGEKETLGP